MANLVNIAPLMQPVEWQGQEYLTSQCYHRHYLDNSATQAKVKYKWHQDFVRIMKAMEAYHLYLKGHDIVELRWISKRQEGGYDSAYLQQIKVLESLFQCVGYQVLYLLNATAQVAMSHHLDNELSQQISVAANTMVARQHTGPAYIAAEDSNTRRVAAHERDVTDLLDARKHLLLTLGYPESQALIEATKATVRMTGFTELETLINHSPALLEMPKEEERYLVSDLERLLQIPREGRPGHALNAILARCGLQERDAAGVWQSTAKARELRACIESPQVKGSWSGMILKWKRDIAERCWNWVRKQDQRERSH